MEAENNEGTDIIKNILWQEVPRKYCGRGDSSKEEIRFWQVWEKSLHLNVTSAIITYHRFLDTEFGKSSKKQSIIEGLKQKMMFMPKNK